METTGHLDQVEVARHVVHDERCAECGGTFAIGESCANRFSELLALDHSREEPWGSRHGVAFAVYSLQHASTVTHESLAECWTMLQRIYVHGDDRTDVTRGLRSRYLNTLGNNSAKKHAARAHLWDVRPLPLHAPTDFRITIQDMGSFAAATYAEKLDDWCKATIDAWSAAN